MKQSLINIGQKISSKYPGGISNYTMSKFAKQEDKIVGICLVNGCNKEGKTHIRIPFIVRNPIQFGLYPSCNIVNLVKYSCLCSNHASYLKNGWAYCDKKLTFSIFSKQLSFMIVPSTTSDLDELEFQIVKLSEAFQFMNNYWEISNKHRLSKTTAFFSYLKDNPLSFTLLIYKKDFKHPEVFYEGGTNNSFFSLYSQILNIFKEKYDFLFEDILKHIPFLGTWSSEYKPKHYDVLSFFINLLERKPFPSSYLLEEFNNLTLHCYTEKHIKSKQGYNIYSYVWQGKKSKGVMEDIMFFLKMLNEMEVSKMVVENDEQDLLKRWPTLYQNPTNRTLFYVGQLWRKINYIKSGRDKKTGEKRNWIPFWVDIDSSKLNKNDLKEIIEKIHDETLRIFQAARLQPPTRLWDQITKEHQKIQDERGDVLALFDGYSHFNKEVKTK